MIDPSFIFNNDLSFREKALSVFKYQFENNEVYQRFCKALGETDPLTLTQIPLIPVEAFREAEMYIPDASAEADLEFRSSGTTGMKRSRHKVKDAEIYHMSILKGFETFYDVQDPVLLAYTPGYSDNPQSSLIYMLDHLISHDESGWSRFLDLNESLNRKEVDKISGSGRTMILFGAAFGLLDLLERGDCKLPEDSIIIETGGMKTHRREMSREDLHSALAEGFGVPEVQVHSEYGMTELLSQAYSQGDEWFKAVPWMQISIRDPYNPLKKADPGDEGLIGIIDLANVYSCAFILTGDRGVQRPDGSFRVLGRWNPSDLRGCNFLIDRD
ncbi:hypothetical protein AB2B38_003665 [Balneola sp. MJW-20]|uniref:LuxE/PaaK family acyltransferase n=1 Tax=Gracilimonas aurantiaca TaxID=3234185 RepID=UPI003465C946